MTISLASIKTTFYHLLQEIFGVSKGAWVVVEPILASNIGNFLSAAVPLATELVVSAVGNDGKLSDDARNQATEDLRTALITQGVETGIEVTTGLLKYAIDTAYHSNKVTTTPAAPSNVVHIPTQALKAAA